MTDREKLIQLISEIVVPYFSEQIADHLLANGVAFVTDTNVGSKWIPVTERLPEEDGEYLCYFEDGGCCAAHFDETEQAFGEWVNEFAPDTLGWCGEHFEDFQGVTHWKLLRKPPEMDGGADND